MSSEDLGPERQTIHLEYFVYGIKHKHLETNTNTRQTAQTGNTEHQLGLKLTQYKAYVHLNTPTPLNKASVL